MRPVLKYPGSKWSLADWIINHMPPHTTYLEPFFGSGAVFFNKQPSAIETINDIDNQVVNLFRVIRNRPEELAELLRFTPWARVEYKLSYEITGDELEDARRFLVRCWQSFGSRLGHNSGWKNNIQGPNGGISNWWRLPERVFKVCDRLKGVQIENQSAVQLIDRYKYREVLIYADPPYVWSTRADRDKGRKQYVYEMADQEHIELLEALNKHPGPVLLSGYESELYEGRLKHWDKKTITAQAEMGQKRKEVLWINPVASEAIGRYSLFWEEMS